MARRLRAAYKKFSGSTKRRARRSIESDDGGGEDDEDYVAGEEDESESSYESDVSPRDSSGEESFDFGEYSSGSDEEIGGAASKRRRASSAAPRKPRRRPTAPDAKRKARTAGSRGRKSRVLDPDGEEDENDEDFSPDEDDDDEDDASPVAGKRSRSVRKAAPNRRKSKVLKPLKTKERKARKPAAAPARKRRRRARSDDDDDFIVKDPVLADKQRKKRKKVSRKKTTSRKTTKRLSVVDSESSDSDFVVSDDDLVAKDRPDSDFVVSDDDFIVKDRVMVARQRKRSKTSRRKNMTASRTTKKRRLEVSDSSDSNYLIPEDEVRDLIKGGIVNQPQPKRIFAGWKGEQKGKEKEADASEMRVCGICLSEEQKMAVQGVLNCCTHYFCFACIVEWSKVESRCPVCKRRFVTITKSSRSVPGFGMRRAVIRVRKRDQVYQPSEEEIRGMLIPYENVVCMVCQRAGDDNLMLLCDECDSPAHTYCVGHGWEVPEGNWYCEGCRPIDDGSSDSQVQDIAIEQGTSSSGLFAGGIETADLSTEMHAGTNSRQSVSFPGESSSLSIDLNLPPRHLSAEDQGVMSQGSGAGSSGFSRRRAMHQHAHDLETEDLSTDMRASTNSGQLVSFPGESSSQGLDLNFPPRHQSGEDHGVASQVSSAGASTISGRRAIQRHIHILLSRPRQIISRTEVPRRNVESDAITSDVGQGREARISRDPSPLNTVSGSQRHQEDTRHIFQSSVNLAPCLFSEGSSFRHVEGAKEQVQSMVRSHLKNLSRDGSLEHDASKEIARRSIHTILAACGIEHRRSMAAAAVEPLDECPHESDGGLADLMRGCCSSCFGSFVRGIVSKLMNTHHEQEG